MLRRYALTRHLRNDDSQADLPPPSTSRKLSIIFHKTVTAMTAVLSLRLRALSRSISARAFFVAFGFARCVLLLLNIWVDVSNCSLSHVVRIFITEGSACERVPTICRKKFT